MLCTQTGNQKFGGKTSVPRNWVGAMNTEHQGKLCSYETCLPFDLGGIMIAMWSFYDRCTLT